MDDGKKEHAKGRYLEVARARLELALGGTACETPAEREVLHEHPTAPRIHHPHQLAWCRKGLRGPTNQHLPLVEHAACVGQCRLIAKYCGRILRRRGEKLDVLPIGLGCFDFFAELEPSITVTKHNLADRVRYILRSNICDVADLDRLLREAVTSSDENATSSEDVAPQLAEQPANVNAAVNIPIVVDSSDDGTVTQELELEYLKRRRDCGNAQSASRKSTATSPS
ncbi:unnamed protein product [Parnassius apollo]|uniref:(apollo) hypothetical protein n=1 Tax=Parnassius apollo TaxID=110799 RepID=A0A8S3Y6U9_PARAO|nr:unnamed protein product [Parnassius apollo]